MKSILYMLFLLLAFVHTTSYSFDRKDNIAISNAREIVKKGILIHTSKECRKSLSNTLKDNMFPIFAHNIIRKIEPVEKRKELIQYFEKAVPFEDSRKPLPTDIEIRTAKKAIIKSLISDQIVVDLIKTRLKEACLALSIAIDNEKIWSITTSPEILREIFNKYRYNIDLFRNDHDMARALIANKNLPDDILVEFAKYNDSHQFFITRTKGDYLPSKVQELLSESDNYKVRLWLVPQISSNNINIFKKLSNDTNPEVRKAIYFKLDNIKQYPDLLLKAASEKNLDIRLNVSKILNNTKLLTKLSFDKSEKVRANVASNTHISNTILLRLAQDRSKLVQVSTLKSIQASNNREFRRKLLQYIAPDEKSFRKLYDEVASCSLNSSKTKCIPPLAMEKTMLNYCYGRNPSQQKVCDCHNKYSSSGSICKIK